jgi:GNAT superfamily N-acetyltransferase
MDPEQIDEGRIRIRREPITSPLAEGLILALNRELLGRYPEDDTDMHFRLDPEEVEAGKGTFLVAFAGGEPVGCGAIRMLSAEIAEIKRMYVSPAARGRGVGFRLLDALETEARALGADRVLLETGPRQPEAIALYSRAGYVETGAFGEYQTHPLSVFMEKRFRTFPPGKV